MGYKFIKTRDPKNQFDQTNICVTLDHNELTITDLLYAFEDFLRACGFQIESDSLQIVEEEDDGL